MTDVRAGLLFFSYAGNINLCGKGLKMWNQLERKKAPGQGFLVIIVNLFSSFNSFSFSTFSDLRAQSFLHFSTNNNAIYH